MRSTSYVEKVCERDWEKGGTIASLWLLFTLLERLEVGRGIDHRGKWKGIYIKLRAKYGYSVGSSLLGTGQLKEK